MPTPLEAIPTEIESRDRHGLDDEELVSIYRTMVTSRILDDREISMKRQQKIFFQISGAGHEAIGVAAGLAMKPGYDWFFPYYRDRALCLQLGMTPFEMLLQAVGAEEDPASSGRQMPAHFGHPDHNIPTSSSPVGSQFLPAVGCAEAAVRAETIGLGEELGHHEDEVVLVCGGEGSTSEGEFWESLNTASNLELPVIYLIEDNGYAISVPVEVQTAGGSISRLVSEFPSLMVREVDGTDPLASYGVMEEAVAHCRERKGPALVHAHVIRPYSHSMSDDERMYKPESEREEEARRDPIRNFGEWLVDQEILGEDDLESIRDETKQEVADAADRATAQDQPGPESVYVHLYAEGDGDPTGDGYDTEPEFEGDETTMVDLLNMCLKDEMARDPRIVVFGEDVADASREEVLDQVKGKGGVFKVTANLQREFGSDRVFNSPLAEANIVGRAMGMATRGLRPVAEIQFVDYIWPAYNQIRSEIATARWRSGGRWPAPAVIRAPYGGYLGGGAMYHSQSSSTLFTHIPGLRVVCPSTALDANGLLRTAIRCDDPVIFFEHKHLYRQTYNKSAYPGPEFSIPFGRANVVREGTDLTVVTYGATVERSKKAVRLLEKEASAVDAEIIDLRSLSPLDMETIAGSVKRTNKVLMVYEDPRSWGVGAEIAARICDEVFEWLDGPVRRVTGTDTFVGYAPRLENAILPQVEDIAAGMEELAAY